MVPALGATAELPPSKIALTSQLQQWCDAVADHVCWGKVVDDLVDRVIASYENLATINLLEREEIRVKVSQYLETLSSAGHRDSEDFGTGEPEDDASIFLFGRCV